MRTGGCAAARGTGDVRCSRPSTTVVEGQSNQDQQAFYPSHVAVATPWVPFCIFQFPMEAEGADSCGARA